MTCCSGKVCPPINWNIDLDDTKDKSKSTPCSNLGEKFKFLILEFV